jgi:protein-S-isoprenylcysteine O-methyltransferase Ste14
MTVSTRNAAAGVIAPPPVLFAAAWAAGAALNRFLPLPTVNAASRARQVTGAILVAAGAALSASVVRCFSRAGTPVSPLSGSRALVTDGPYRYSRNPDYIGQTLIYAGTSMLANQWWPLLVLPFTLMLLTRGVIEREERYLARQFGAPYREYMERVPRWIQGVARHAATAHSGHSV